MSVLIVAFVR